MFTDYVFDCDYNGCQKIFTDFVVVGSGIAGAFTALKLSEKARVIIVSKGRLTETNSTKAQGGIACALSPGDSGDLHYKDTIEAGAGLCNTESVRALVEDSSRRIKELLDLGVNFDKDSKGELVLAKEGAHSCARILRSGGDSIGKGILSVLIERIKSNKNIEIYENTFCTDLLHYGDRVCGVLSVDKKSGCPLAFIAKGVILATGGIAQVYKYSTNWSGATGDGIAMAFRAGAPIVDMEFVQFHPTALLKRDGEVFLISEAVRGEGGILINKTGERFMQLYHRDAELAPRDVVSRGIFKEMLKTNCDKVFLDITHKSREFLKSRFPTIFTMCYNSGIDISKEFIPVSPAAHYSMGGIMTNIYGETGIKGLFAVGETSCNGVHGANRLASNSLLDCIVFGARCAEKALQYYSEDFINPEESYNFRHPDRSYWRCLGKRKHHLTGEIRKTLKEIMTKNVGIIRDQKGLKTACDFIRSRIITSKFDCWEDIETLNMLLVSYFVTLSAIIRKESRGAHYREDYPAMMKEWEKHIILQKRGDRIEVTTAYNR